MNYDFEEDFEGMPEDNKPQPVKKMWRPSYPTTFKNRALIVALCFLLCALLLCVLEPNSHAQTPIVAGFMYQDATGKTIIKPIGRGLYADPSTGTIRSLSWGGLFSTVPNTLWITPTAGGNAGPVRLDPTKLQVIPDPSTPGGFLLTTITPTSNPPVPEEVPVGTLDGVNVVFTLLHPPLVQQVYRNGIRQKMGAGGDYTVNGNQLIFVTGAIPQPGDSLLVDYTW
jgi:hypothetical protein